MVILERTERGRGGAPDVACLAVIVLAACWLFRGFLSGASTLAMPPDGAFMSFLPEYFFASELKAGRLPLWNPHDMSGYPAFADPQYGLWYPLRWGLWSLGYGGPALTPAAFGAFIVLHIALAGAFMYALARALRLHWTAALVAGFVWAFAPNTIVYAGWPNALPGMTWWPCVILCLVRGSEASASAKPMEAWGWAGASGVAMGVAGTATAAQLFIQLIVLICAFYLFLVPGAFRARGPAGVIELTARTAVMGAIGIGMAMPTLLPALELTHYATRFMGEFPAIHMTAPISLEAFTHYRFEPEHLAGLVLAEKSHSSAGFSNFIGPLVILAAAFGAVSLRRRPRAVGVFAVLLAAVSLLYMFGVVLPTIFYTVPGLKLIREPAYYASYLIFAAALLAAIGIDGIVRGGLSRRERIVGATLGGVFIVVLLALAGAAPYAGSTVALAFAVIWLGLIVAAGFLSESTAKPRWAAALGVVAAAGAYYAFAQASQPGTAKKDYDFDKVLAASAPLRALAPKGVEPHRVAPATGFGPTYTPNIANVAGFYDTFGYHNPVITRALQAHLWLQQRQRMQALLNVKYIVTDREHAEEVAKQLDLDPQAAVDLPGTPVVQPQGGFADLVALSTRHALGHAWAVNRVVVIPDPPETNSGGSAPGDPPTSIGHQFNHLLDPAFDPKRSVIVETHPKGSDARWNEGPDPKTEIVWRSYDPGHLRLTITADRPAMLVISEVWQPAWRAMVNGAATPVYRADGLILALAAPAGVSEVELSIDSLPLRMGAGAALAALAAGLGLMCISFAWLDKARRRLQMARATGAAPSQ